jgi:hypothetical protein
MLRKAESLVKIVGALMVTSGLASFALAQNPSVNLSSTSARPGETATVRLSLSGAAADVSAVNITVKIDETDAALVGGPINGTMATEIGTGFTLEQNPDADLATDAIEYRAVLYPAGSPATPPFFDATGTIDVIILEIPVSATAAPDSVIDLVVINQFEGTAGDTVTGLVGISDASGVSVRGAGENVAAGETRTIDKVDGLITIASPMENIDFGDGIDGWQAFQAIPSFHMALPDLDPAGTVKLGYTHVAGTGVEMALVDQLPFGSFGYFQTENIVDPLEAGKVFYHTWTLASNAVDPNENPNIRLRAAVDGLAQISEFMEPNKNTATQAPSVVPVAGDGDMDFTSMLYMPASVDNGERDFLTLALDALSFYPNGKEGNVYTVKGVAYSTMDPTTLSNPTDVYTHDYSGGDADGFTFLANQGYYPPEDAPGLGIGSTGDSASGLEVTPQGPPQAGVVGFAYGIWEKALTEWTVVAGKIYEVEYTVATSADAPVSTNISRLRVSTNDPALPGLSDFVFTSIVESGGPDTDTSGLPTQAGVTFKAYIVIPDALAGKNIKLSFDGYQTTPGFPFLAPVVSTYGSVTLKDIKVTSYDRPAL